MRPTKKIVRTVSPGKIVCTVSPGKKMKQSYNDIKQTCIVLMTVCTPLRKHCLILLIS